MKVVTVLGTRPEIIRLSRVIPRLDEVCEQVLVFTGQNFSPNLSTQFFEQLGVRRPEYSLDTRATSTWAQIGNILAQTDAMLEKERPDRFLVLGDTNSALSAQCAKRRGIPVYHMEAGNRCFDDRVPEEVNRRVIDHASDVLLPYTNRSRDNLLAEGIPARRIYVTGNPILEVMEHYAAQIAASDILERLGLKDGAYFLVTLHRAENVDVPVRLDSFMKAFAELGNVHGLPVLLSLHPHTRQRLQASNVAYGNQLRFMEPPGFFDFVHLEQHAKALLSDSGTVQEEGCLLGKPTVTLRDVTERPETLECGANILSGCDVDGIIRCLEMAIAQAGKWAPPEEYRKPDVSFTLRNILMGRSL